MSGEVKVVPPDAAGIVRVQLCHAGKRNAMSVQMWRELRAAFAVFQTDAQLRCVLVEGGSDGSGSPVIRIPGRTAVQPARVVADLRAYWDELRQGRAVPTRADVQPAGIGDGLDYAFILERIAPGAARFRLAGRHLVDLMGMEVRGMPLCSVLNAGSRGRP